MISHAHGQLRGTRPVQADKAAGRCQLVVRSVDVVMQVSISPSDFVPRSQFLPFHKRKQRWACLICHRRCGKTFATLMDLLLKALRTPHGRLLFSNHCQSAKHAVARCAGVIRVQSRSGVCLHDVLRQGPAEHRTHGLPALLCFELDPWSATASNSSRMWRRRISLAYRCKRGVSALFRRRSISVAVRKRPATRRRT
jgi:hypothetical protein